MNKSDSPQCELCPMPATGQIVDPQGIVHHFCDHHMVTGMFKDPPPMKAEANE